MSRLINIFRGIAGLNNKVDPKRLVLGGDGPTDAAAMVNCDLDDTFRLSRRKGYTQVMTSMAAHSLFDAGTYCLFVSGNALAVMDTSWTVTLIRNVTPDQKMRYCRVGSTVFYLNGIERGKVYDSDRLSRAWNTSAYVGHETNRSFSNPITGHLIAYYNSRIYIAKDNMVWHSEPFADSWFDLARNYIWLGDRVRMIAPVDDGIFISDDRVTCFFGGAGPMDFLVRRVADYPALEGTEIITKGGEIGSGDAMGTVALWASPKGICMGGGQGYFKNLTEDKVVLPDVTAGAAILAGDRYICSLT